MHISLKLYVGLGPNPESQDPPKRPVAAELGAELCADRSDPLPLGVWDHLNLLASEAAQPGLRQELAEL